ncbi:Tex family protein [Desulfoferrobacter suflitae]|uniref:Tex family protein n=1 Tax=Desulfoferrobacter suflitae TaxID=2865782 RepID=UPI0021645B0A|nr:Tex family protein [Desulfoferrobacter suflitae]MCK8601383.1 RNA-binding transcriptional accessory protein [Desulfoferrobacter suflitae]
MHQPHTMTIANELNLLPNQVDATVGLLQGGASVPFIARYRKEATGSLDETVIVQIRDRLVQLEALEKRRETILDALQEQGNLTEDLRRRIARAETLAKLEDLYLPFRPKRRTRAGIAREKGLEPLARLLLQQKPETRPAEEAQAFLDGEKGVSCGADALAGARDIIAEWVSENVEIRASLRTLFMHKGILKSNVIKGKEAEAVQYRDYYEWEESVKSAPSHRILATRRGEREGFLNVRMVVNTQEALAVIDSTCVTGNGEASQQVREAGRDAYKRLLAPSLESELKQWAKERADKEAIRVFADNLRHLLMAPPLGNKRLMAIDPGFRTGCKVVCLDGQGKLLQSDTVYPHSGKQSAATAAKRLMALVNEYQVQAIAVGNGTAGRETQSFVRALPLPENVQVIMTDESGASVYSASQLAREEFPDEDVTVRGAISIGRRLMDPLAELVKIDPKSIGVGQYQHDVDQKQLKQGLDDVVMSCVNAVGVEVNTASAQLLAYVSGLGPQLARNLIGCRDENGPFRSRRELKKVPRLGAKAFEQAAGFLRIRGGDNPLDASAVHPESYGIVEAMAKDLGCGLTDLIGNETRCRQIDLSRYVDRYVGLPTLKDIQAELAKPGRDPRDSFEPFAFADGVQSMEDLAPGMKLPGIVTNVTVFGAFVDIGVHRDGLVHLSELADRFVKDAREVVHVHQQVMVTVLEVDLERKRISLSMKKSAHEAPGT